MAVAGINNSLFPPIVETAMPAFIYSQGVDVYFSLSLYNNFNDIANNAQVTVRNQKDNLSALKEDVYPTGIKICTVYENTDLLIENRYYIHIDSDDLEQGFQMNTYYKVQIRFTGPAVPAPPTKIVDGVITYPIATWINDNLSGFSEWSTVCLVRPISKPILQLNGFDLDTEEATFTLGDIGLVGSVSFDDGDTEYLKSYRVRLYDNNEKLVKDSGQIYANKYANVNQINYDYEYNFEQNINYYVDVSITTNNLYSTDDKPNRYTFMITEYSYDKLEATIAAIKDKRNGRIGLHILGTTSQIFVGSITIRRSSSKTNFSVWEDVHTEILDTGTSLDYTWYDGTIQSGVWYKYCAQKRNSRGHRGVIIELKDPIMMDFEDIYISAEGLQLNVNLNPEISQYSHNVIESRNDTIGSKYPFIKRNGNVDYRVFSLSGIVSAFMSNEQYPQMYIFDDGVIKKDSVQQNLMKASRSDLYGDYLSLYDNYNSENHINYHNDYIYEHDFRQKVIEFLYKHNVKLYRSATEGNILVKLMDISFTPDRTTSRLFYNFSCTAVEVDKCSVKNCDKYNIQSLGAYSTQLTFNNILLGQICRPDKDVYSIDSDGSRTRTSAISNRDYFEANKANAIVNNDPGAESLLDKKYQKLVKDLFKAKVGYLSYLKIQFTSNPYLIKIVNNKPVPLAKGEQGSDALINGYIVYINDQPTVISKDGLLELKGSDVKVTSLWFPEKVQGVIDYIAYIAEEEDLDKIPKMYSYIDRIGQKWGHFFIEESFYRYLTKKYNQNYTITTENSGQKAVYKQSLVSVNGVRITAAPGTTVYVRQSRDTGLERHVIGDTGMLEFYDEFTNVEGLYFAGTHLEEAHQEYNQNNVIPPDRFVETGISINDFSQVEKPITNGVYWLTSQAIEAEPTSGDNESINVDENNVIQLQDSIYDADKVEQQGALRKNYISHNAVATGIAPVGLRLGVWVSLEVIHILEDVPRAIYFLPESETVAVVPFLHNGLFFGEPGIGKKSIDLLRSEPELVKEFRIGNTVALEVVEAGEDTFSGDAQTAGEDGKLERGIGLECRAQQIAQEHHHFLIVARLLRVSQRYVVFVDEQDSGLTPVRVQGAAKGGQGPLDLSIRPIFEHQGRKFLPVCFGDLCGGSEIFMITAQPADKS